MATWSTIRGIMGNLFGIGGPAGSNLKYNGGAIEARDSADAAFVNLRALDPAAGAGGLQDVVTKAFLLEGRVFAWARFDAAGVLVASTPGFAANAVVTVEAAPVAHIRYRITHASVPVTDEADPQKLDEIDRVDPPRAIAVTEHSVIGVAEPETVDMSTAR